MLGLLLRTVFGSKRLIYCCPFVYVTFHLTILMNFHIALSWQHFYIFQDIYIFIFKNALSCYASSLLCLMVSPPVSLTWIEFAFAFGVWCLFRLLAHAKVESAKSKEASEKKRQRRKSWFSFSWFVYFCSLNPVFPSFLLLSLVDALHLPLFYITWKVWYLWGFLHWGWFWRTTIDGRKID